MDVKCFWCKITNNLLNIFNNLLNFFNNLLNIFQNLNSESILPVNTSAEQKLIITSLEEKNKYVTKKYFILKK